MNDQEGIKIDTKLIDKENHIYLVNLGGYVDQANVHILQNIIDEKLKSEQYKLIFDLKDLKYMSSAGWGVLIGEIKRFRENDGDIKLINMGPEVYEIYQVLEFYHIISEYSSLSDATEGFSANPNGDQFNNRIGLATAKHGKDNNQNLQVLHPSHSEEHGEIESELKKSEKESSELIEKEIDLDDDSSLKSEGLEDKRQNVGYIEFNPLSSERKIDAKMLPLPEKVRKIVAQYPQLGLFQIRKALKHTEFGGMKVGILKLRSILKELDLDSKEKRFRFYRSV
jgi:anti-sigma B factor antagonist